MKKTVFAAQVFALIAMLPIVVILEMNHVPPQRNMPSGSVNKTINTFTGLPEKTTDKLPGETFSVSLETFLLKTAW
jgi:hypothetical protein